MLKYSLMIKLAVQKAAESAYMLIPLTIYLCEMTYQKNVHCKKHPKTKNADLHWVYIITLSVGRLHPFNTYTIYNYNPQK